MSRSYKRKPWNKDDPLRIWGKKYANRRVRGKLPLKRYPPTSPPYIKGCMNNGILEIMNLVGLELRLLKLKRNGDMII